jgi:hypothetical protein
MSSQRASLSSFSQFSQINKSHQSSNSVVVPDKSQMVSKCLTRLKNIMSISTDDPILFPFMVDEWCGVIESMTNSTVTKVTSVIQWLHDYMEDKLYCYIGDAEESGPIKSCKWSNQFDLNGM